MLIDMGTWKNEEIQHLRLGLLDLFGVWFSDSEADEDAEWPRALCQWKQIMLPKNHLPQGVGDFRPITVGSAFYRLWSGIRTKDLAPWIQGIVGDEVHGGIKKRSPATFG